MIRSLRRKFILIAMLSLLGTLTVLCAAIVGGTYVMTTGRADRAIDLLYQNGGEFPPPDPAVDPARTFGFQVTQETPFETRYFVVTLTGQQQVRAVDTDHIAALDRQTVVESVSDILRAGADRGYEGYYRYGVFADGDGGSTIIVLDCFLQLQAVYNTLRVTLLVSVSCAAIVFALLVFFSGKAIRPFVENLERQRQFVTDASHELKTPLAILSANIGLLEDSCGGNQWLERAQAQVGRLDRLIKNLVELARTEETIPQASATCFSVSEIAQAGVDGFRPLAQAAGKSLAAEIAPELSMWGVRDDLFRLFSILLDNGVKYCDPGGTIRLSLARRGRTIQISVSNPCREVDPSQLSRYFDRFYRADSSRARATGGYGIGLSTAKAIVTRHRGHIVDRYTDGIITFLVTLPQGARGSEGCSGGQN